MRNVSNSLERPASSSASRSVRPRLDSQGLNPRAHRGWQLQDSLGNRGVQQMLCGQGGERSPGPAVSARSLGSSSDDVAYIGSTGRPGGEGSAIVPPIVREVLSNSGQPLDPATRTFMEQRFNHDFRLVRLHTGARAAESARAVNAQAYTVGADVVFATGSYAPETIEGRGILAHELTHVVQQGGGRAGLDRLGIGRTDPDCGEREADRVRSEIQAGAARVGVSGRVAPKLARLPGSPAGGCGVCYGHPGNAGTAAHMVIQAAFKAQYPNVITELSLVPSPTDENGRLDLAMWISWPDHMSIGEIKPDNDLGRVNGESDLRWYTRQLEAMGLKVSRLILPPPLAALPFPTLAPAPCPDFQDLYVNAPDVPVEGVYTYWCRPDYAELVGQCPCKKKDEETEAELHGGGLLSLTMMLTQEYSRRYGQKVATQTATKAAEGALATWGSRAAGLANLASRANLLVGAAQVSLTLYGALANYAYSSMYIGTRGYQLGQTFQYLGTLAQELANAGGYAMELEHALVQSEISGSTESDTEVLRNELFDAMFRFRRALYFSIEALARKGSQNSAIGKHTDWGDRTSVAMSLSMVDSLIAQGDRSSLSLYLMSGELESVANWYAEVFGRVLDQREAIVRDDIRNWLAMRP